MDYLIRKAMIDDIEELRKLYLALEEDGVRYQPEHFVIGERTEDFFNLFSRAIIKIFWWRILGVKQ